MTFILRIKVLCKTCLFTVVDHMLFCVLFTFETLFSLYFFDAINYDILSKWQKLWGHISFFLYIVIDVSQTYFNDIQMEMQYSVKRFSP